MSTNEKKGVTVKIDADLHAEVKRYIEEHEMTMGDFVALLCPTLKQVCQAENIVSKRFSRLRTRTAKSRLLRFTVTKKQWDKIPRTFKEDYYEEIIKKYHNSNDACYYSYVSSVICEC